MKKAKRLIGLLIVIIGAVFYLSQTYLEIDLLSYIIPDTTEPTIDVSSKLNEMVGPCNCHAKEKKE